MKRSAKIGKHTAVAWLIWVAAGCQFDPYADDYTRTKPKTSDLAGTYVLARQTLTSTPIEDLKATDSTAKTPHKLILRADGTFTVTNIPVWIGGSTNGVDQWSIMEFRSGSGKWQLNGSDIWWLTFTSPNVRMPTDPTATLVGEKPPYSLMFVYNDPDGGDVIIYDRENANAASPK